MNKKLSALLVALLLVPVLAFVGDGRVLAKEPGEEARERAEERAEEAEERAEERAEEAEEQAEEKAEEAEEKAEEAEERAEERAEKKARRQGGGDEGGGSGKVKLELSGDSGASFSGTCSVGDEEESIDGEVPESYIYELSGQRLECEIRKEGSGTLKVALSGDGVRAVQRVNSQDATLRLAYGGVSFSTISTS